MVSLVTPRTATFSASRRGARVLAAALLLVATHVGKATAADISLFQSDPVGQSSFNTGTSWTGGAAPTAGNNYLTGTFALRTPSASSSNFTFAGDALTIDASGALRYMGLANSTPVITVNNLIMDGGQIINGANEIVSGTSTLTLSGTMTVKSNSGLNLGSADSMTHNVVLNSTLTGTGGFYIGTSTVSGSINPVSLVTINGNNSGFSGGVFISRNYTDKNNATVTLNGTNATYPQIMSSATIRLGHVNALGTGQLAIDAGTVDLNGLSPTIGSLAGAGGAVVNNGGGAVTLTVGNDNTNSSYSGIIRDRNSGAGTLALTKAGTGVLTLSGSNSYTGGTQLNAGVLAFGHTSALGTGTVTIGSGTLRAAVPGTVANPIAVNAARIDTNGNAVTLSGVISGSNGLTKVATTGTLTLAGDNTFTGNVVVDGTGSMSVLVATRSTSLGTGTKTVTVAGYERSLVLDGSGGNITLGSNISYSFSNETSPVLRNLSGTNTVSGSIGMTVGGAGTLIQSDAGSLTLAGNIGVTSANSRNFILSGSASGTVSGTVGNGNGTTTIIKQGNGTWTLSGSNTYTGGTQINAGVLAITNTSALGTGTVTISSGTLRTSLSGTLANSIAANAARFDTNGNAVTLSGVISGSNGFTKVATSGTLTLAGDNSFTGDVSLDGFTSLAPPSVLVVTRNTSLGTGAKTVTVTGFGRTLILDGSAGDITLASTIGLTLSNDGSAVLLNRAGNNTISGSITMTSGGAGTMIQSDAGSLTLAGNIGSNTGSRRLTLTGAAGGSVSGNVGNGSGTVAITKSGAGTWTLSGSNTYSGATTVSAGVLIFSRQVSLYGGTTANWTRSNITFESGATLGVQVGDAAGGYFDSTAVDTLLGAGGLGASDATSGLKSGALFAFDTTNATGGSFTYASAIANPNSGTNVLGVVKLGSGTLTLSGSNTYTGGATVSVGRLTLGHANALGTGTATVGGGELDIATSAPSVAAFRITTGTLLGTGTLTAPTYGLGGGTVTANLGSGTVTVTANSTLSGMSAATTVNLNAGTLTLGGGGGRFTSSSVAVSGSAGASLTLAGNESFGSLAGAANVTLGGNVLSVGGANTNTTYSGTLSGAGGLTKIGSGTLTLSGSGGYSGGATINAGRLTLGHASALGTGTATIGGGELDIATFAPSVAGFRITSGTLLGTGTLTASSYALQGGLVNARLGTGPITVSAGTTTLGAAGRFNSASGLTISSGQLTLGGNESVASFVLSGGVLAGSGNTLTSGSTYDVQSGSVSANLGGAVGLTKSTTGTVTLSGANTFSGQTRVSAGVLALGAANAISNQSNLLVDGGGFNLAGFSDTVGTVTLTSGSIFGTGTLTGSSYALQGGALASILGSGPITVSAGTTTLGAAGRFNSASGLTISSGQLTLGGNESVAGFVLAGGVLAGSGNTLTSAANHDIRAGSVLANLGGSVGLMKSTIGTAVLGAANAYSGATSITAGLLEIAAAGSINSTSGITVNGSTAWLAYNSATALSQSLALTQGMLSGTGTIDTAVAIGSGVFHSPGNSPGIQTVASEIWNPGGTYVWELNALEGSVGTNWDQIVVTGLLDLDALSTVDRFNLNLVTLTGSNTAGPLAVGYAPGSEYRYTIATFGSLTVPTGFTTTANSNLSGLFTVNLDGWQGTQPNPAQIYVRVNSTATGIDVVIVPEPGALALAAAGLGAVSYVRWRRRRLARAGATS